ncbi:MAG: hypothetical protein E6556_14750 [Pantoea sp.]|uniref:Uncharacterized protein n=1 Tax=Mixta hanseatica TaxID=2872648 RepID=A0ABY4RFY7_9GAMM|nr:MULTISPECIES: hypothetical protein [Mixta]MDU6434081.1 hypothetical protein [Pantoea sp.]UQY46312.1 hypothetical protein K6958_20500 [Mixta hanseatica]
MTYTERAKNEVNHTVMPACETDVTVRNPALERGFCHLTAARRFFYALFPPFGNTSILPDGSRCGLLVLFFKAIVGATFSNLKNSTN